MRKLLIIAFASSVLAITGCSTFSGAAGSYDDLTVTKEPEAGKSYRLGNSGIVGKIVDDHILITHVIPGSVADGKILKGDKMRGMQHRSMAGWGGIQNLVRVRMYRLGRDWDWHFFVTVERDSLRGGKGNTITYDLRVHPDPGNICHYGPTGFFAKRYTGHLVIESVEEGSPSDGKILKGDVILAVDGKPITVDGYDLFTEAIDKAESKQGAGVLKLKVSRTADTNAPAEELDVALSLKILGSYSKTAPIKCKKTDALIAQTADSIVKNKNYGQLNWGVLGLLATGEEKYIKVVRDYLHAAAWAQPPADVNELLKEGGYVSWHWGYRNLLMTEYYLRTGDKFVLPAITQLSRSLALGQDQAGLWGHRMCHPELGRAYGYGIMNQPTIPIFISLILAQKCGVDAPVVKTAVDRTHRHYDKWVGEGSLPYGNHGPNVQQFTNNGTSGSLAVALALLGNKRGASFYAAMSSAATDEILTGHGGPRWNILWSGLAASVAGPEMVSAYNKKVHWLRTVTRKWDGRYVEMKGWGSAQKSDATGIHLLSLCTGRRAISITGKGMDKSLWVKAKEAEAIVEVGTLDTSSLEALLSQLGSPYPPVRLRAAQQLAKRDAEVEDEVMELLAKGNEDQRIGAIHAIQSLKIADTADELMAIAKDEKNGLWVRQQAVRSLGGMDEAKKYAPELLKVLVADKPYDPYLELDIDIGNALVKLLEPDPYEYDLDKDVFYAGALKLLDHKHTSGRAAGMALIKTVPAEEFYRVADKMLYVINDKDKTYRSYTGAGRQEALEAFYRLGVKESIDLTISTAKEPTGRGGPRLRARTRLLKTFGAEAKYAIPKIKEVLGKGADEVVKIIEESKEAKKMISFEEAKKVRK